MEQTFCILHDPHRRQQSDSVISCKQPMSGMEHVPLALAIVAAEKWAPVSSTANTKLY